MTTISAKHAAVVRLFALTGIDAPKKRSATADLLAFCPEDRLVRAVAWYAREKARGVYSVQRLCDGIRAISAGWDDLYQVGQIERGSTDAALTRGVSGSAVALRPAVAGKWSKPVVLRVGEVRGSVDLAAAWLEDAASARCRIHTDCDAHHDLGLACVAEDAA